jgi:hypothetical protein
MSGAKAADGGAPPTAVKLLSPLDRAKAEKAQMIAEAPAKAKAAKEAAEVAAARGLEANKAISALREAENAVAAARASLASAVAAVAQAKTPEATERAQAEQSAAETKLAEASRLATEAGVAESAATQEALAAATAAWEAEKASDLAAQASRAGERNTEPISIFVSKKTGRVYVRQAWRPLYEAPATIKDPASPLGTHVYVAVETKEDNSAMRWVSITYPQTTSGPDAKRPPQPHRSRRGDRSEPAAEPPARPHETAAGALDRVALNEETKRFIADRLWVGASIIVSDYGLSDEAGKYTDFIVQPR